MATDDVKWRGPYQILAPLAAGGMGEVFAAVSAEGSLVAIKKMLAHRVDDPEVVLLFEREARLAMQVCHPNVIRTFEVGAEGADRYLAMELFPSVTLGQIFSDGVRAEQSLPVDVVVEILAQAADGLFAVHNACDENGDPLRIVHRDLSPQNILVGDNGTVKLADFGVAKALATLGSTVAGGMKGKFAYMSPEHVTGEGLDHRTDLFSFGVVAWEALAEERLFSNSELDLTILERINHMQIPPLVSLHKAVPKAVSDIVERCLQRDMALRPTSAAEVSEALRAAQCGPVDKGAVADALASLCGRRLKAGRKRLDEAFAQLQTIAHAGPVPHAPAVASAPNEPVALQSPEVRRSRRRLWVAFAAAAVVVLGGWAALIATDSPTEPAAVPVLEDEAVAPIRVPAVPEPPRTTLSPDASFALEATPIAPAGEARVAATPSKRRRARPGADRTRRAKRRAASKAKEPPKTKSTTPTKGNGSLLGGLDEFGS